ncbi:DMT family transporter [Thalassovita sp.]|jgi:drug/metabolite transporter (DMT)-like permease|uniref:DMT family transporter n=1 Tax=Thalassovita sp. TaxID=1979401 RepID=UPI003B5C2D71
MSERANVLKASLWMTGSIASFTAMAIAGREVSGELDTFEIMTFRSIVGVIVVLICGGMAGTLNQITRRHLGTHFIRNIGHFAGQNLWFYSLPLISLAQVFALEFTAPLWVILLSPLILGERITPVRALAAIFGFIGILIVARPTPETLEFGQLTAALAAIGFAISIMFTSKLTRTETITCVLFYLTTMQAAFGIICAGIDGDIALPSLQATPWLVLIGLAGLMGHFSLTNALSIAPATVVVPFDFARLPLIALIGWLFYNEALELWVGVGALVIFGANYLNIWGATRK